MEDAKQRRLRSMSDPTDMFQMDKEVKKSGGLSHFFHKLPFLSGKHHRQHNGHSHSDDEFCDIENEIKAAEKQKSHNHGHETGRKEKMHRDSSMQKEVTDEDKLVVMVNDGTDTELDHGKEELIKREEVTNSQEKVSVEANNDPTIDHENGSGDANISEKVCTSANDLPKDEDRICQDPEEEPLHEPPSSPLPPPPKSCLKLVSCCFENEVSPKRRPMRKRSISVPEGDPNIIFRLNRHVHFSPDTVEPTSRNCKYREWIERHSNHGCVKAKLKHEKRMQQLRQIHSLDINDYLSKGHRRYHNVMTVASPMPALGCDIFM